MPALNVIANYYSISSDIAGATLMAAGASSPELFSSIVSLFVTHSSLGLGTIVGSEIFNQLIICAGAVYASSTGSLTLDKVIVTREVGFYALGIGLLYVALRDSEMDPDDPEVEHIYISFLDAALLFGGYLLYVLVCANMERIVAFLGVGEEEDEMGAIGYGTIEDGKSLTSNNMKISRMVCCPRCVYVHTPFQALISLVVLICFRVSEMSHKCLTCIVSPKKTGMKKST